jgi:hypothetical protein
MDSFIFKERDQPEKLSLPRRKRQIQRKDMSLSSAPFHPPKIQKFPRHYYGVRMIPLHPAINALIVVFGALA